MQLLCWEAISAGRLPTRPPFHLCRRAIYPASTPSLPGHCLPGLRSISTSGLSTRPPFHLYRWTVYLASAPFLTANCLPSLWPNELSIHLPFLVERGIRNHGFEPWSSQPNDFQIDSCHILSIIWLRQGLVASVTVTARE